LLESGITDLSVEKRAKATKKRNEQLPQTPGVTDGRERFFANGGIGPVAAKTYKKYLRMLLWACLSTVSLAGGSIACGLLSEEESTIKAVLLFLAALAGATSCIFFFYLFLREISPKPKGPFIATLR